MIINKKCKLVLKDLYLYDIQSAFPKILQSVNYDFQNVNLDNKTERNIFIGKQQKDNENLSEFLNESVNNLIKFYLQENNISDDEVIVTQKDGVILTKKLLNNDELIELKFRGFLDFLIISIDRNCFLYLCDDEIIIKGVPNVYDSINSIYQKFLELDFYNKKKLFRQMEDIKNSFILSTDKKLFMIPHDNKFLVRYFKEDILISDQTMVDIKMIDKRRYFNHYFKGFLDSIFITFY